MMSVLIVDDHPSFRASARRLFEAEGFNVVGEAADGREGGIAAALELKPDLVLLDVQLPDLDGFKCGRLAALGLPSAVVLTSTRNPAEYGPIVADTPMHGFVPKAELSGAVLTGLLSL